MLALTGCAAESKPPVTTVTTTVPTTTVTPPPEVPELVKDADTEILSCSFKDQILPTDHEVAIGLFPGEEGKILIDLTLEVRNTGEAPLGKEDFTAYFSYGGKRYDMQFEVEENAGNFANKDKTVQPGDLRKVHLFYTVDTEAADTAMTVHYTILGEAGQIDVAGYVPPVLEDKTEVKIGTVFTREGDYSFEVLDCMVSQSLRATGNGAKKYYVSGSDVFVLILKVRNEGDGPLDLLEGYLMAGEMPEFAQNYLESEDHLELIEPEEGYTLNAGEEQILHLWIAIPPDSPTAGMAMRLNVQCDSFYCYPIG